MMHGHVWTGVIEGASEYNKKLNKQVTGEKGRIYSLSTLRGENGRQTLVELMEDVGPETLALPKSGERREFMIVDKGFSTMEKISFRVKLLPTAKKV